jgi:hypothetical protein
MGNIIPVFFPIIGWIIHLPAYLQETEFIITGHYIQCGQIIMPQTELRNTRTNTLWLLYVHEHQGCHTVKVGVVAAE